MIIILTLMLGLRRTSPMPPPFRSPSFSDVTIHMIRESQYRSFASSSSWGAGAKSDTEAKIIE